MTFDRRTGLLCHSSLGGLAQQEFRPGVTSINSISVIIGLDETTADPDLPHPVKLVFRAAQGRAEEVGRVRPNIVDNGFTRFDFGPKAIEVERNRAYVIRITNLASEPICIWVKTPGVTEIAPNTEKSVVIVGRVDNEVEHEMGSYRLAGAVTTPSSGTFSLFG